jgi:hypothetical protein
MPSALSFWRIARRIVVVSSFLAARSMASRRTTGARALIKTLLPCSACHNAEAFARYRRHIRSSSSERPLYSSRYGAFYFLSVFPLPPSKIDLTVGCLGPLAARVSYLGPPAARNALALQILKALLQGWGVKRTSRLHLRCTVAHAETECAPRLVGWPAYPRDL